MITEYNKKLNSSYNVYEKYNSYKSYRKQVTDRIMSILSTDSSLLIVGAGNLSDLDLSALSKYEVTLLDIDEEAMKEGIKRQGLNLKDFTLIKGDLTGLETTDFFSNLDEMRDDYLLSPIKISLSQYDIIIVLPIYTQLLLPQLIEILGYERIQAYLPLIQNRIDVLNNFLREHLKPEGKVIAFSDVLEYDHSQEEYQYLKVHENNAMLLDDFYTQYLNTYGHGLGSYGLFEMSQKLNVFKEDYLIWPFSKERLMLIKMIVAK